MSGERHLFFLPRLLEKGLCEDNSQHYALLTYQTPVMSRACREIVKSLEKDCVPIDTKKRVKFLMEFLAVALELPIADHDLMKIAVERYGVWLADMSFFGDSVRQNKYMKRIITQLSLPFAFREPRDSTTFASFVEVLKRILTLFDELHRTKGQLMEKATWVCLFDTMLGICDAVLDFNFQKQLEPGDASKLREMALDLLFSVLWNSGLKDEGVWNRFSSFSRQWNWNLDYVVVWGRRVNSLFKFVNARIYGFEPEDKLFRVGVYTPEKTIDNEMMSFVFHGSVFALDTGKMANDPELMSRLATSVSSLVSTARSVAKQMSALFLNKFPAMSFLKLFGPFLTFAPVLNEKFDPAVSVNIESILNIVAKFDGEGAEEQMTRLMAYVIKRIEPSREARERKAGSLGNLASFLANLTPVYAFNSGFIPYLSDIALKHMPDLRMDSLPKSYPVSSEFFTSLATAWVSAAEVLCGTPGCEKTIENAFNTIWSIAGMPVGTRFILLCAAHTYGIPVYAKVAEILQPSTVSTLMTSEEGQYYIVACIEYIGTLVRADPRAAEEITKTKLIPLIVDATCKDETLPHVLVAVHLFILSLIEWGGRCLQAPENINAFFTFVHFMEQSIQAKDQVWAEEPKRVIKALFALITSRVNCHMPMNDFFTRRLDSAKEINEKLVIESLKITDAKTYYYTVGEKLLVSFIEKADGSAPLVVFARGAFGKAIWTVADDYQGKLPEPKLSDEIPQVSLPEPVKVDIKPLNLKGETIPDGPAVSLAELEAQDEALRKVAGKDFSTWLNWDVYGFYTPFNQKAPFQRPRVIDFLTTMGILDQKNQLAVRCQTDSEAVKAVIGKFDALEVSQIAPVVITHILSEDETMKYSEKHHQRMTSHLQTFMREIAEPMAIDQEAAKSHGLPELRTTVPMIVSADSFGAVLCPAMAKEESGAREIAAMADTCAIRIIFNETGFEVLPSDVATGSQFVLIVKPTLKGLYHVWQISTIENIISPFGDEQTLTAQAIGFNISLLLELATSTRPATVTQDLVQQRCMLISELCKSPVVPDLGAMAVTSFTPA